MGCASSNPLAEGGKNLMDGAKNATDNVIGMGEKAMHDAGDAVNTGIDHVKNAMESGIQTAQNSIGSVINSVEDTLGMAKENATDTMTAVEENVEEAATKTSNAMEETISDAKTVLAFEDATSKVENEIEAMEAEAAGKMDGLKDEFGETVEMVETKLEETLHIEDIDEAQAPTTSPTTETTDGEDSAPAAQQEKLTPWEAAADNIRKRRISETVQALALEDYVDDGADGDVEVDVIVDGDNEDDDDFDVDGDTYTSTISTSTTSTLSAVFTTAATITSDVYETSTRTYSTESKDYPSGNTTSDILLSDTISIKSYKSEI